MQREKVNTLGFFTGGVPAGAIFQLFVEQIKKLLTDNTADTIGRTIEEISFIGVVSYFEAFCKDSFASIINICPDLLPRLARNSHNISIDSIQAIHMQSNLPYQVGFLVTEKYDFGSARKINSLYGSLISITPFSKKEIQKYDKILSDRNLLVHHGGIYTSSYLKEHLSKKKRAERVFFDSLVISKDYVLEKIQFLELIVKKILNSSKSALLDQKDSGKLHIDDVGLKALRMFDWWDNA